MTQYERERLVVEAARQFMAAQLRYERNGGDEGEALDALQTLRDCCWEERRNRSRRPARRAA